MLHVYYKKQLKQQVTGKYESITVLFRVQVAAGRFIDRSTGFLVNVNAGLSVLARALSSRGYGTACTRCSGTRPNRSSSFTLDAQVLLSVPAGLATLRLWHSYWRLSWPSSGAVVAAGRCVRVRPRLGAPFSLSPLLPPFSVVLDWQQTGPTPLVC